MENANTITTQATTGAQTVEIAAAAGGTGTGAMAQGNSVPAGQAQTSGIASPGDITTALMAALDTRTNRVEAGIAAVKTAPKDWSSSVPNHRSSRALTVLPVLPL